MSYNSDKYITNQEKDYYIYNLTTNELVFTTRVLAKISVKFLKNPNKLNCFMTVDKINKKTNKPRAFTALDKQRYYITTKPINQ